VLALLLGYILKTELWDRYRLRRAGPDGAFDRPATNLQIITIYLAACKTLAQRGLSRLASTTPDEFVEYVEERAASAPDLVGHLARLTQLYTRFRYGPDVATDADVQAAREAAASLTQALTKVKKSALVAAPA